MPDARPVRDDLETTKRIYDALDAVRTRVSDQVEELLAAVTQGETPVAVELPWTEGPGGTAGERRQVLVTRIGDGRVYFVNSIPTAAAEGAELGGPSEGPLRRIEPAGEESIAWPNFDMLWSLGGRALIVDPPSTEAPAEIA